MRNKLAGTKKGTSKSALYYQNNPEARAKKAETDKKINERPEQVKKRVESNGKRAEAKKAGKDIKGKDYDHAIGRFISYIKNRGRKGEGGRKKKAKSKLYKNTLSEKEVSSLKMGSKKKI